jgi:hypothetical protein
MPKAVVSNHESGSTLTFESRTDDPSPGKVGLNPLGNRESLARSGKRAQMCRNADGANSGAKGNNPDPAAIYNLVIIGAARQGSPPRVAKVALIERALIGGNCLNTGCVPSKAIIRTSRLYAEMRTAEIVGARTPADIRVDLASIMERMRRIRARISRAG